MTPAPHPAAPAGPLRIGSLCTGYGGLDLAVTAVLHAELAWCADNDPRAAAVLAATWPGTRNLGDITALDWAVVPPVDLITVGWPFGHRRGQHRLLQLPAPRQQRIGIQLNCR